MGTIGYDRHEFLYDLRLWEIRSIARGYQRRLHPFWEMARLTAYCSAHCMGAKNAKPMNTWLSFWWEKEQSGEEISEEDVQRLRQIIAEENEKAGA